MGSRSLNDLCPEMRSKAVMFLGLCKVAGIDILIYCTYRPDEEQAELYAQGRTRPGKKVTWTLKSKHNLETPNGMPASEAFDCVPVVNGKLAWDRKDLYIRLGEMAKQIGLKWGGDWDCDGVPFERGEYDSPHFELIRKKP